MKATKEQLTETILRLAITSMGHLEYATSQAAKYRQRTGHSWAAPSYDVEAGKVWPIVFNARCDAKNIFRVMRSALPGEAYREVLAEVRRSNQQTHEIHARLAQRQQAQAMATEVAA